MASNADDLKRLVWKSKRYQDIKCFPKAFIGAAWTCVELGVILLWRVRVRWFWFLRLADDSANCQGMRLKKHGFSPQVQTAASCQLSGQVTAAAKGFTSRLGPGPRVAFLGNGYRASDFLALDIQTGYKTVSGRLFFNVKTIYFPFFLLSLLSLFSIWRPCPFH